MLFKTCYSNQNKRPISVAFSWLVSHLRGL
jgi:hypothetical protein